MKLNVIEMGEGSPVLLLHGLFGAGRNWGGIQKRLAQRHRVLAPDLRNHGDSPHTAAMGYADMAADICELIRDRGLSAPAVLGHSMGGKVAMALALRHPEMVGRLVVADIAPVKYPPSLRGYIAGMRAIPLREGLTRREADAALEAAVPEAGIRAFLLQSLDFSADPPAWKLGLAELAAAMPGIEDFDIEGRYDGPVLVLAGAQSGYIRRENHALFRRLFPRAEFAEVERAGHWLHADNPNGFLTAIGPFLA
ncbi:alpha/beta fold hydrolase [Roseococcus sp. YIM B11640]|uniref:alpha/beta fold hydrolase n=1 Tax=Roseococcus sp. YIM B11640 TaxID=3133973 RepID=UPI003C7AEA0B